MEKLDFQISESGRVVTVYKDGEEIGFFTTDIKFDELFPTIDYFEQFFDSDSNFRFNLNFRRMLKEKVIEAYEKNPSERLKSLFAVLAV